MAYMSLLTIATGCIVAVYPKNTTKQQLFWLAHMLAITAKQVKIVCYAYNEPIGTFVVDKNQIYNNVDDQSIS